MYDDQNNAVSANWVFGYGHECLMETASFRSTETMGAPDG
jgi:hypothetical protein